MEPKESKVKKQLSMAMKKPRTSTQKPTSTFTNRKQSAVKTTSAKKATLSTTSKATSSSVVNLCEHNSKKKALRRSISLPNVAGIKSSEVKNTAVLQNAKGLPYTETSPEKVAESLSDGNTSNAAVELPPTFICSSDTANQSKENTQDSSCDVEPSKKDDAASKSTDDPHHKQKAGLQIQMENSEGTKPEITGSSDSLGITARPATSSANHKAKKGRNIASRYRQSAEKVARGAKAGVLSQASFGSGKKDLVPLPLKARLNRLPLTPQPQHSSSVSSWDGDSENRSDGLVCHNSTPTNIAASRPPCNVSAISVDQSSLLPTLKPSLICEGDFLTRRPNTKGDVAQKMVSKPIRALPTMPNQPGGKKIPSSTNLDQLYNIYLQWLFLEHKSKVALGQKMENITADVQGLSGLIQDLEKKVKERQTHLDAVRHFQHLYTKLQEQEKFLEKAVGALETVGDKEASLAEAIRPTRDQLLVTGIILPEVQSELEVILSETKNLQEQLNFTLPNRNETKATAQAMFEAFTSMSNEIREKNCCQHLLSEVTRLTVEESSLKIDKYDKE